VFFDGVMLAEAMAEHMERREWIELDSDDHYVKQVSIYFIACSFRETL
jgi:hypothetical protein